MSSLPGTLYVVATPIGNLEDITLRALRILGEVDIIAAEDTRYTGHLLQHFGLNKPLLSLYEHNESDRLAQIASLVADGKTVALVSDAGTPLISDPGFPLVRELRRRGLPVVPVPGPSSVLAALSVAGLPTDRFVFEGFLPARSAARRTRLQVLAQEERTLIFFESGQRITETVADLVAAFGADRLAVIARELTKHFEQIQSAPLPELLLWLQADHHRLKGEFVILTHGAPPASSGGQTALEHGHLLAVLLAELPLSRAVAVAVRLTGLSRKMLYAQALALQAQPITDPAMNDLPSRSTP